MGLQLCWNAGHRNIIVETDCGQLLDITQNHQRIRFHALRFLLMDIVALFHRDWTVSVRQISRDANTVADFLAKSGAGLVGNVEYLESPPLEVEALLLLDFPATG